MNVIEEVLKTAALELEAMELPRSEHHLGYLIQIHLTKRVGWGELASDHPVDLNKPDPRWAMDIIDLLEDEIIGFGVSFKLNDVVALYRLVPDFIVREYYRLGEWTPARHVTEQEMHGFEVVLVAAHRLLKGRVVSASE